MAEKTPTSVPTPVERRRFLSESLRGSVPLLVSWATARVRELARLIQEPPATPKTSPPPAAKSVAPAPARQELDRQQEEFARENPGASEYPSA
ncbi:MAG: hypothetical protein ACREU7_00175 [Burkholderiales bacterium]